MKKIYIVLQSKESKKLLLVQDEHGRLSLPCHKHWPVVKAVPQKKWNESLVRHITYGLLDVPSVKQPTQANCCRNEIVHYLCRVLGILVGWVSAQ